VTPSAKREILAVLVLDHGVPLRRACQAVRLSRAAHSVGLWKSFHRLRRAGHRWNHKRVHRVYRALRLDPPRRTKWRVPTRVRQPLVAPARLNETWALDFMADALYDGRSFRTVNVLDEGNREGLAIEIGASIPSARVVRVVDDCVRLYGRPGRVRVDNGPELTAEIFAERFNRSFREEVLDAYLFDSLGQVPPHVFLPRPTAPAESRFEVST
jgi:putative transposase